MAQPITGSFYDRSSASARQGHLPFDKDRNL